MKNNLRKMKNIKKFNVLTMSAKLYILILCFVMGFIVFGLVFTNTMNTVRIHGTMYHDIIESKDIVADILPPPEYIVESSLLIFQVLSETDEAKIKEMKVYFGKLKEEYFARHKYWTNNLNDNQMKELLVKTSYEPAKLFYEIAENEFFPALLSGDKIKAEEIANTRLKTLYGEHRSEIDKLVKLALQNSETIEQNAASLINRRLISLISIGIVIVILTCALCYLIIQQLLKQLGGEPKEVSAIAMEIAKGNLMVQFDTRRKKQGIYGAIQDMTEKLKSIVSSVAYAADSISSAGRQVSVTTQQISNGTNEQSSTVEEISASVVEMLSNIKQNAENAKNADKIAGQAAGRMMESDVAVKNSTASIKDIAGKISIIGDIAFQTNILSLNASVEAARAGEHGRGFAVVASEVRKLAENSRIASDEINTLSATGVTTAESALKQFNEVIPEINNTARLIQEIYMSSEEQAAGVAQISYSVQVLNDIIQQNAAASEQMATSAEELANQAEEMKSMVNYFKVDKME